METIPQVKNRHLTEIQRSKFRIWLQKKFTDRCQKNSRYSLRAFSNHLNIDASSISQILSGKRSPSIKTVTSICERLSASEKELKFLGIDSFGALKNDFHQISEDEFAVISDWYHYALLELTFVSNFRSDPNWISDQLGISVPEAKLAIERMIRLGLISQINDVYKKTQISITNHTGPHSNSARKTFQKQVIQKALSAVDEVPQEDKDITSITMAIDPENMDQAREMIKTFRRDLCALVESGNQSRVYNLAIQFYPISKKKA